MLLEKVQQNVILEGTCGPSSLHFLNLGQGLSVEDHLNHSYLVPSGQAAIGNHPEGNSSEEPLMGVTPAKVSLTQHPSPQPGSLQIKAFLLPEAVHDAQYLQGQHVLAKIYTCTDHKAKE